MWIFIINEIHLTNWKTKGKSRNKKCQFTKEFPIFHSVECLARGSERKVEMERRQVVAKQQDQGSHDVVQGYSEGYLLSKTHSVQLDLCFPYQTLVKISGSVKLHIHVGDSLGKLSHLFKKSITMGSHIQAQAYFNRLGCSTSHQ